MKYEHLNFIIQNYENPCYEGHSIYNATLKPNNFLSTESITFKIDM